MPAKKVIEKVGKTVGSIWFYGGRKIKLEVLKVGKVKSMCKVLETTPTSKKFVVGDELEVRNSFLYPRQERKH